MRNKFSPYTTESHLKKSNTLLKMQALARLFTIYTLIGNYTREPNQTSKILRLTDMYVVTLLSALNIFLSITASLGNAVILVALHKESFLHPPTKLLFRCLAVTELCVGLITQPLFAASSIGTTAMSWKVRKVIYYIQKVRKASSFKLSSMIRCTLFSL